MSNRVPNQQLGVMTAPSGAHREADERVRQRLGIRCAFRHPRDGILGLRPRESVTNRSRPGQGRQTVGHSVGRMLTSTLLLLLLDSCPSLLHVLDVLRPFIPEHVRVSPNQLLDQGALDVIERPTALLLGNDGVKPHMEQHVTELFDHCGILTRTDRIDRLGRLLEQVRPETLMRLLSVPGATVGCTQRAKNVEEGIHDE